MIVAHNLAAMNANRRVGINTKRTSKTTEKLSSGYRINRSADDAAGLSISEKMRHQIRGLTQASTNCQDGISFCQVADGALNESHDILQRMNELSVKAANDTNTTMERDAIQDEIDHLIAELNRIATTTTFNEIHPLNGGNITGQEIELQVGAGEGECLSFFTVGATADELGVSDVDVSSNENAGEAITKVTDAIDKVNDFRSQYGAIQNRLEHTISNLDNVAENTQAAESRVRDADMAEEMMKHSANNILSQASQSMLVQANQQQQGVLSLLQ